MRINFGGTATGWTIRAVRYRGTDVTDSGIDFKPNEDIADLEIEITNRVTDLSGVVTNSRGTPVKDYSIAVFPQDRDKWTPGSRYLRSGRPDQDGRFKLTSLPPGDYFVIALDYMDASEWTDPEFLERIRTKATRLSISEGETKSVDLKVTTAS
jgi:Carboxypeptidase regulatory-like domain